MKVSGQEAESKKRGIELAVEVGSVPDHSKVPKSRDLWRQRPTLAAAEVKGARGEELPVFLHGSTITHVTTRSNG